jgi:hypothetical protein
MLEGLRDFKAVNCRTNLELYLGAGAWSEGRGVQKKHRAVNVIVELFCGLWIPKPCSELLGRSKK